MCIIIWNFINCYFAHIETNVYQMTKLKGTPTDIYKENSKQYKTQLWLFI